MPELSIVEQARRILFLRNPARTSLGVFLGVAIEGLAKTFAPALREWPVDPEAISIWWTAPLGVVLLNLPSIIHFIRHRSVIDESVEQATDLIDQGVRRGVIPKYQAGHLYLSVAERALAQIRLAETTRAESRPPGEDAVLRTPGGPESPA
jgi:hypothetical protein